MFAHAALFVVLKLPYFGDAVPTYAVAVKIITLTCQFYTYNRFRSIHSLTYCYLASSGMPSFKLQANGGILPGYGLEDRGDGVRVPVVKNLYFTISSGLALEPTQSHFQRVPVALSPGVKRMRYKADHSPPTTAEVKDTGIYTSTPAYALME